MDILCAAAYFVIFNGIYDIHDTDCVFSESWELNRDAGLLKPGADDLELCWNLNVTQSHC